MKCECEECSGTGQIDCPNCDGTGELELDSASLESSDPRFHELKQLERDEARVNKEALRLIEMKPEFASSYSAQLKLALQKIDKAKTALLEAPAEKAFFGFCKQENAEVAA